ncbi:MAG TPA: serine hydrolase domain-containing protein [Candidatus Eisenbacteria bacterium]|nr:serine hydrolase domain-containing protein [Candidatus Eisenbacteria bacterium]
MTIPALLIAFAATTAAPAAASPPASPGADSVLAGGAAFVAAVNDSSAESRRAAIPSLFAQATRNEAGDDKLAGLLQRLHDDYAPLEYHHGERAGRVLHVFARRTGARRWHDFQFFVDPEPPNRFLQLAFIADVAEPVYLPNGSLDAPETLDWLNRYIDRLVSAEDLSGAVLVAKGDRVLLRRAFGHADLARATPVTDETRFGLGSGNKMFTALVVMSLVREGALRLDQTLSEFLPDFPDPALARAITVRHLLSHASGLGDYLTEAFKNESRRATRIEEFLPFAYDEFRAKGPHFAPGTAHRYSNTGFLLLGRILEKVTGRDYYDLVRERIYAPLGMTRTDHYLMDGSVPGLATPLTRPSSAAGADSSGRRLWTKARQGLRGTSAGGGFSTCGDIFRFARALAAGRIVPRETLADMTTPQPPLDPGEPEEYGLGMLLQRSRGGVRSFGHGGIAPGVNFELRYFPDEEITLIAFSNQDNGAYDDLRKNLIRLVTGER